MPKDLKELPASTRTVSHDEANGVSAEPEYQSGRSSNETTEMKKTTKPKEKGDGPKKDYVEESTDDEFREYSDMEIDEQPSKDNEVTNDHKKKKRVINHGDKDNGNRNNSDIAQAKKNKIDRDFANVSLTNIIKGKLGRRGPKMNNMKGTYADMSENHTKVSNTNVSNTTAKSTKTKSTKTSSSTKTNGTKTDSAKVNSTTNKNEQNSKKGRPKNLKKHSSSPLPIINEKYSLSFVIEGHTNINIPVRTSRNKESNQSKDIWCCDFEPHRPGQVQTDVAALAGSYTVLFLDVQQGKYTKKYTHSETQEIFYSMAWTTVNTDTLLDENRSDENKSCNVLAVAGRLGSIKLLNPLQNECYRYLFGHNGPILKMVFSKYEPRWLFSASADKTVLLWDIGSPTSETDDSICLAKFALPLNVGQPSALSVSYDLSTIVVGCSDGNLVRFHLTFEQIELLRSASEGQEKERVKTVHPEIIYPNGSEWHEGYVDDVHILGQDNGPKNELSNHIVSRGSEDREIVVWNAAKSKPDDIDIYKSLNWPDAYGSTGLRYKIIEQNDQKVLIAGDYDGNIHLFDIGDGVKSKTLPDNSKEVLDPFRVLSHEMSTEPIRDVACSMDTRSIVVVDTENHAFVWRC